jgi:hypothetical protein
MRVDVQPAEGKYKAKNTIKEIITPDMSQWFKVDPVPADSVPAEAYAAPAAGNGGATAAPAVVLPPPAVAVERPSWAG